MDVLFSLSIENFKNSYPPVDKPAIVIILNNPEVYNHSHCVIFYRQCSVLYYDPNDVFFSNTNTPYVIYQTDVCVSYKRISQYGLFERFRKEDIAILNLNKIGRPNLFSQACNQEEYYRAESQLLKGKGHLPNILTKDINHIFEKINDLGVANHNNKLINISDIALYVDDFLNSSSLVYAFNKPITLMNEHRNSENIPSGDAISAIKFDSDGKNITLDFSSTDLSIPINVFVGVNGAGKTHAAINLISECLSVKNGVQKYPINKVIVASNTIYDESYLSKSISNKLNSKAYYFISSKDSVIYRGKIKESKSDLVNCVYRILTRDKELKGSFDKLNFLKNAIDIMLGEYYTISIIGYRRKVIFKGDFLNLAEFLERQRKDIKFNSYSFNVKKIIFIDYDGLEMKFSSGQQAFLAMVLSIIQCIETNSLVIVEEPENFFHPKLLIDLIKLLDGILVKSKSVGVIITHSPFVVREVFKNQVHIFYKQNNIRVVRHPENETYAEDIYTISSEVFDETEYPSLFKEKIKKFSSTFSSKEDLLKGSPKLSNNILYQAIMNMGGK